ncbi:MAG: hypothetical protein C0619_10435 [Desulfuromonas sp.]|nr:MAG: hypothetical protein C0619_10435 [Desulfuromonas sp.]
MIGRIWALALVTFKEGLRDRSLYGIFLFALFVLGLNVLVAGFFMRDLGKVTVDMNLSALSFAGLLLVFFIGINLMAKDIDKKTIHLVLSKPFSRGEYIWGKFTGLVMFVGATQLVLLVFSSATVAVVRWMYPNFFAGFSWGIFITAVFFVFLQHVLLCAIVVFFSSLTSSSFISLIFSLASYIVGITLEEVVFYLRTPTANEEVAGAEFLQRSLEVVTWLVPNFAAFDFKLEAAHGLALEFSHLGVTFGYACLYIMLLLILASVIFSRREFN